MTSKRRQKDRSFRHQNYYCGVQSCLHRLILLFIQLRVRFRAYKDGQILHLVIYRSRGIVDKICHVNQVFNSAFLVVIIWGLDDVLDVISDVWETFLLIEGVKVSPCISSRVSGWRKTLIVLKVLVLTDVLSYGAMVLVVMLKG